MASPGRPCFLRTLPVQVLHAVAAAFFVAGIAAPVRAQAPAPADLAARVQAHYATVQDFTADFVLSQQNALLPKPIVERGEVKIKKPGRMRWTYTTGDRQQFVADGTMVYAYFPRDRYVTRTPIPTGNEVSTALLFLTGRGNLTRDFVATMPAAQPDGEWHLHLTPRAQQADFESLTLQVDRTTLAFRGMIVVDQQGGTSAFRFNNLRENRGLSDNEFTFTIPRGVEIR